MKYEIILALEKSLRKELSVLEQAELAENPPDVYERKIGIERALFVIEDRVMAYEEPIWFWEKVGTFSNAPF